jgi:hypothetical protein
MSALTFGFLILSTVPFLLLCLWGFHCASRKRVVRVTLLLPNKRSLKVPRESVLVVPCRPLRDVKVNSKIRVSVAVVLREQKRAPIALTLSS